MNTNEKKYLNKLLRLQYSIHIDYPPQNLGGGVLASIPELGKDVFVSWGETEQDAIQNLNKLRKKLLTICAEDAIRLPLPNTASNGCF